MLGAEEKQALVGSIAVETGTTEQGRSLDVLFTAEHLGHLTVNRQRGLVGNTVRCLHHTNGIGLIFNRHRSLQGSERTQIR